MHELSLSRWSLKDYEFKGWNRLRFISSFSGNKKAGKPVRFGNPAIFKPHRFLWLFDYDGSTNPLLTLAKSRSSHLGIPNEIQRPVASGPPPHEYFGFVEFFSTLSKQITFVK